MNGDSATVARLGGLWGVSMAGQTANAIGNADAMPEMRERSDHDTCLADAKRWANKIVGKPKRPLRNMTRKQLQAPGVHNRIMALMHLKTLGEARDMVGEELRRRMNQTGG